MAGLSMWGPGSEYGGPTASPYAQPIQPMHTGQGNPFDSPAMSEYNSLRPPSMFPYQTGYPSPSMNPMDHGPAPRNSVMSGLNTFASGGPALQNRFSSYSLATTANPFGGTGGAPPAVDDERTPSDDKVLDILKRYLASQDLMSM